MSTENGLAIVSTIKHVTNQTSHWVQHHLQLVSKIFLFIDHPGEGMELEKELTNKYGSERLSFIHKNEELIKQWKTYADYERVQNLVERFVTVRQALNIEYLLHMKDCSQFKWVFHLDDDELLFYSKKDQSLGDYLKNIPDKYDQLVLQNYEAIPTELDTTDFFAKQKTFKKSPPMVSLHQLRSMNERLKKNYFFTSYNHGKFAFSPAKILARGWSYPDGVHRFHPDENTTLDCNFLDLAVLHYPFPNFGMYFSKFTGINRKRMYEYEALGDTTENFYSFSRGLVSKANPLEMEKYYSENVIYSPEEIAVLHEFKLLLEIE